MNEERLKLEKVGPTVGLVGVVGLIAILATLGINKAQVWQSYTYGWLFGMGLTLGALGLMILHNVIRAKWTLSILRLVEAAASPISLIVMFILWMPIALNLQSIYLWARPEAAEDHVLHAKAFFLNPTAFYVCTILYFGYYLLMSSTLRASSLKQDQTLDVSESQKRANIASPGYVLFVIVSTFAVTHWTMSLEPHWYSTVFPLLTLVGCTAAVLAICTIVITANAHREPYHSIVKPQLIKDLGNMLFALTMVWAYLTLSQFLIIWSGNLPEEIPYYRARSEEGWHLLTWVLILGRFFIPFFLLLAQVTKRSARTIMLVSCWILAMHVLDVFWQVVPSFERGSLLSSLKWTDLAALLGVVGVWLASFASQVKKGALVPTHDTRLSEKMEHA